MSAVKEEYLKVEKTDDSFRLEFTEILPLTCTTEFVSGDCSVEIKQEQLPVVKQEPDDVCYIIYRILYSVYHLAERNNFCR